MKTIRKILPAIILVAVMLVMSVVGVSAEAVVLTEEDTTMKVDITQYTGGYEVIREADFENGSYIVSSGGIFNNATPSNTEEGKGNCTVEQIAGLAHIETASAERPGATDLAGKTSNMYFTMTYQDNNPNKAHTYLSAYFANSNGNKDNGIKVTEDGFVFEFDVTCHPMKDAEGNTISGAPDGKVPIQVCNLHSSAAEGLFTLLEVSPSTATEEADKKFAIIAAGVTTNFKQGTWVHVTVHFDPVNHVYKIYLGSDTTDWGSDGIGRKFIGSVTSISNGIEVYPVSARVGGGANKGNVSYDNFVSYQGSCVRNPYFYENLNDVEMFKYLVGQLGFLSSAVTCKSVCDIIESEHIARYYNRETESYVTQDAELISVVDDYLVYYDTQYATLIDSAKAQNLAEYQSRVATIAAMPRSLYNHEDRQIEIDETAAFLIGCGEYIDVSLQEFIDAKTTYDNCIKDLERDVAIADFVNAANKFVNAQSLGALATMQKKYEQAYEIYTELMPEASEYPEGGDGSRGKVADAIEIMLTADDILAEQYRIANTNRFINIVDKISETTMADWENDDGTIENLWRVALNIVADDNYEKNLSFYEAYTRFVDVNSYFWGKIQNTHIAAMREKLDEFENVNYIEKEGICAFVDSYLERYKTEIDTENEEISAIIALNTQYKDRLPTYKEDYKSLLEENSVKFVGIVARMNGVTSYADLKAVFDEATEYYYSMNISGDDAIAAVLTYERARLTLEEIEYTNGLFTYEISLIKESLSDDEIYDILFTCYRYYDGLDLSYTGVNAAKQTFDRLYGAYVESSSVANSEIGEITAVVSSVRSFCGVSDLMRYAADYLGK